MCCTSSQRARRLTDVAAYGFLPKCFQPLESEATQVQKSEVTYHPVGLYWSTVNKDKRSLLIMTLRGRDWWRWEGHQILDQDLWALGDRSREEAVPSRFGRVRGMCPFIRLGNCGGREESRELARRGRGGGGLRESGFPVRNCSIVTARVSCFFGIHCASSFFVSVALTAERDVYIICTQIICNSLCSGRGVCVCFTNEEQLLNQSTRFRLAPLGSNRKYSQDFLSLSETRHLCWTCLPSPN